MDDAMIDKFTKAATEALGSNVTPAMAMVMASTAVALKSTTNGKERALLAGMFSVFAGHVAQFCTLDAHDGQVCPGCFELLIRDFTLGLGVEVVSITDVDLADAASRGSVH